MSMRYPSDLLEAGTSKGEAVMACRCCGSKSETVSGVVPKVCGVCGSGNFNVVVPKGGSHD